MDFNKYDAYVQKLVERVERQEYQNEEERLKLCEKLYNVSRTIKDSGLSGYSCYCSGAAYFENRQAEEGFAYLSKGIHFLSEAGEWLLLGRSYNMLALLLQYQGNFLNAMDCFITGIEITEEHHLDLISGILYQNFSTLCEVTGDYERALFYRRQSQDCFSRCENSEVRAEYELAVMAMLLRLYIKLNKKGEAERVYLDMEMKLTEHPRYKDALEILVNRLEYACMTGAVSEEVSLKDKALEVFFLCEDIVKYFDECISLANYLKEKKEFASLEQVLERMGQVISDSGYAELYMQIIRCRIEMYELLGKKKELSESSYQYFKLSCRQREEMQRSFCSVLNLKISLKQAEVNNIFLSAKADLDALTGIPNRRKMNEDADRFFEMAVQEQKNLGFEMLDIDYFKNYNDAYGHSIGDRCIAKLAAALQQMDREDQICARYGGDEFFVIYYGLSDEEILKRCRELKEKVAQIGTELGLQTFTISQGIANWVPQCGNRVWDFTSAADEALYHVKNKGRDNICLIHSIQDLKN